MVFSYHSSPAIHADVSIIKAAFVKEQKRGYRQKLYIVMWMETKTWMENMRQDLAEKAWT